MSKSNKYGYVGVDIPEQSFGSNKGIFDPAEINELVADNKWTSFGQLELIKTGTFSSTNAFDIQDIKEDIYNVHFLVLSDVSSAVDNGYLGIQFFESGTIETAGVYKYARHYVYTFNGGTAGNFVSTIAPNIQISHATGSATNEKQNVYCYIYNAGDNTKYTFQSGHSTGLNGSSDYATEFGSGALPQTSVVDGFRLIETDRTGPTYGNISGDYYLYGIRSYK